MNDLSITIAALFVHPVKSCGALRVNDSALAATGLAWDREWMLVDPDGEFVTQRELPRLARVTPQIRHADIMLRAPGMLALHLSLDTVESERRVRVWDDVVQAFDMGDLAAQWFSDFAGRPLRLVRFDPDARRLAALRWTGGVEAPTLFTDGFPLLVLSTASLEALNRRLQARGQGPVGPERFRANLLLDGLDAHGEDALGDITFETDQGPVRLTLVKPCSRCGVPDVDPATGVTDHAVGDTLAAYRADPRLQGAITFGMNAIINQGEDCTLRVGMSGRAQIRF